MKRRLVTVGVVALVGMGAAWLWWFDQSEPHVSSSERVTEPLDDVPQKHAVTPRFGGRVAGRVINADKSPAKARVTLRSTAPFFTVSLDDGSFLFEDVPEGAVFLSASTTDSVSEVLGPIQLTAAAPLADVVLVLGPAVKVDGVIVDLVTRAPIPQATVISAQQASRTDAAGHFQLAGARQGLWLDVMAPGYLSRSEWVSLELARAGGRLELVLTPASRIEGTVTESGAPVTGATVWAEHVDGANRGVRTITVFSGKDGHFVLEGPSALLRLSGVTPRGSRIRGPLLRLAVGEKRSGIMLEAGEVSSVQGLVTREGQPLAGASLSAIDALTEDIVGAATSLPDGRFEFGALSNGRYVVQVRTGEFSSIAGPFEQTGDGRRWDVALKVGGVLEGRVEPASAGVRVRWRSGSWSGPSSETVTDEKGHFHFEGLSGEVVSLDAEGPSGAATTRAKPGDAVVLTLAKGQVVVHLADDSGGPVTDGVLTSRSLDTGAVRRQLVLAPDGVTRVDLPAGVWELSVEVSARGRSAAARVEVRGAPVEVTLTLEASVVVHGTVTDEANHLPISGAFIEARSNASNDPSAFRVTVVTDARGDFVLPPTPKRAVLTARHPKYKPRERAVGGGEPWLVSLTPEPAPHDDAPALQFEGIGMMIDPDVSRGPRVAGVNEGSPAERAGVQKGDVIMSVDGTPANTLPMDQLISRIRGPAGTEVRLSFMRGGQQFELSIRRRMLTL